MAVFNVKDFQNYENALRNESMAHEARRAIRETRGDFVRDVRRDLAEQIATRNRIEEAAEIINARKRAAQSVGGTLGNIAGSWWSQLQQESGRQGRPIEDILKDAFSPKGA